MKTLPNEIVESLKIIHIKLFPIIKKIKNYIRTFVIQLKNDEITIGGNCNSTYKPIYYDPLCKREHDDEIRLILEEFNDTIILIFHEIQKDYPKFRSYNIYFNKHIYVCKNALGAISMNNLMLFEKIVME